MFAVLTPRGARIGGRALGRPEPNIAAIPLGVRLRTRHLTEGFHFEGACAEKSASALRRIADLQE
jgi:hypothetical protein